MESSWSETKKQKSLKKKSSLKQERGGGRREGEDEWTMRKKNNKVAVLEGYINDDQGSESGGSSVGRTKSLTDEDLEELRGCLDLGFGFSYDEIPELCNTLPALELCYSMSKRYISDEQQQQHKSSDASSVDHDSVASSSSSSASPIIANWKISSPGDHPDEVKARLKYWAQAVACTVKLCS